MKLTKRHARKILNVIGQGLTSGLGVAEPGKMCVMAAINYAIGNEHGDKPDCVHPVIRSFDIGLNDSRWSSNEARAKGMRREAIAKLGSTEINSEGWLNYVIEQHIRRIVPIPFRIAASRLPSHAKELRAVALRCEKEGTREAAIFARDAAYVAAAYADAATAAYADAATAAYVAAAYADAATAAAYVAATAAYVAATAAYVADAAADAADAAADAATAATAAYVADAAAAADAAATAAADAAAAKQKGKRFPSADEILTLSAEIAVEACIKFKTQGSKWLDLVEEV